jgi:methylenetetrahydrofolate reductase (NADPH)
MKPDSKLAGKIGAREFVITAEYLPPVAADGASIKAAAEGLKNGLVAISVADNHHGIRTSSMAASSALLQLGLEPIYQIVTRDRNRIALQSDLLGASVLGVKNILCTSGHHQTLMDCSDSANVYDLDAIQLIGAAAQMRDKGALLDGTPVAGVFGMLIGAVVNPFLRPMELNLIQLAKKIEAGADFVQTHPVFDLAEFEVWLDAARKDSLVDKTAIIAGVLPLTGADEATQLQETYTNLRIPDAIVERLSAAGGAEAQEKEGLTLCAETVTRLKAMKGVRGIHVISGGKEKLVPSLLSAAGL